MSKYAGAKGAVTLETIRQRKEAGEKIVMVTCYDAAFARIVDRTEVDIVLVGDSLGNVMMGLDDTVGVTVDHMIHHSACVSRVLRKPFLAVDMPFGSYQVSPQQALENALRLMQEGGAQAVKVEGGREIIHQVEALTAAGVPVIGHLGLTPQKIHALSGYKVQGRSDAASREMLDDALALEQAGVFCLVLELIPTALAASISQALTVPTIGIGAGSGTGGQVLVLQDLLGFDDGFKPRFLKHYANIGDTVADALNEYSREVKQGLYPDAEHSFES